jgi:hypothetical protein
MLEPCSPTKLAVLACYVLQAAHPDIQDDVFSELQAAGLAAHDDDGEWRAPGLE